MEESFAVLCSSSVAQNCFPSLDQIQAKFDSPKKVCVGLDSLDKNANSLVTTLHGDLSDQEEGQSRHPERYRASRRGQAVDAVFPVVSPTFESDVSRHNNKTHPV